MSNSFEWIETYENIANKLLSFKNNRSELLQDLEEIYDQIALKYPFIDGVSIADQLKILILSVSSRHSIEESRTKIEYPSFKN